MWQYIIRRIAISIVILFGVAFIIYCLIQAMPGDYVSKITTGKKNVTPEMIARLNHLLGLDKGLFEGFFSWCGQVLRGNFGESFFYFKPVTEILGEKMVMSFTLALPVFVLELLIAVPLGIISATKPYTTVDYTVTTFAFIGLSLPTFFFATILKRVFAYGLGWLPPSYIIDQSLTGSASFFNRVENYILPVTCLLIVGVGGYMRYARTNMMDVLNADYIRTARAKGLSERTVIYKHAFRNTLIPIVTMIGGAIPGLFAGAMITENLFGFPGIGWTGYQALQNGDIPLIMAFNVILAALTLLGTLLADISYALVDPRVRLS